MPTKISGVYTIKNTINNKVYVGCTCNVVQRFRQHKSDLKLNKHKNRHLQSAYNEYGKESLLYEVLEVCESIQMLYKEEYWISVLNSTHRDYGYNIQKGGIAKSHSLETKQLMSQLNAEKGRKPYIPKSLKTRKEYLNSVRIVITPSMIDFVKSGASRRKFKEVFGSEEVWRNIKRKIKEGLA